MFAVLSTSNFVLRLFEKSVGPRDVATMGFWIGLPTPRTSWGCPNSWMVYNRQSQSKMDDWWFRGTQILGNLEISHSLATGAKSLSIY